ncbi:MmcQ/YjbR family DNA-binding protein [Paenibacillus koleovorans]|uniref:MmcQ/YjbR family DNA-binding protein n=1 Tax=Paenibacillus koleovorans TaxID=121608 RepID=UPI000FD91F86|nr:MmcQ/YjbR family DNA-binding protein [Paenibacillus koleovorans]
MTPEKIRQAALAMPEAEEQDHWGKSSFRVRGKIFAVFQEDGVSLLLKASPETRTAFTTMDPDVYTVPSKYTTLNYMIARMDKADDEELRQLLIQAWREVSPKRLVKVYDEAIGGKLGSLERR